MADSPVRRYASAIFEIAKAEDVLDEVEDELFRFSRILEQEGELRMALTDSTRPVAQRQQLLDDLLEGKASSPTLGIIGLIVGSGRARQFGEIVEDLLQLAAAEKKRAVGEVTSAVPLNDGQRERLTVALSRATGKEVEIHVMIDPRILGGIIAKVGDRLIDGSVLGRLERLRDQIESARAG